MKEIYWITRLDSIISVSVAFTILFGFAVFVAWIMKMTMTEDERLVSESVLNYRNKACWPLTMLFLFFLSINIFVPSKNEMFMIYGIGGTIDYVKNNETLQELPDKCVYALDVWVDTILKNDTITK